MSPIQPPGGAAGSSPANAGATRYLTVRSEGRLYALPADRIGEIIPVPPVARLPLSPVSLLGLASLRGAVTPLISLRGLLGQTEATPAPPGARAVVMAGGAAMAVKVDAVEALVSVAPDSVETVPADGPGEAGPRVLGAFPAATGAARILDVEGLARDTLGSVATPRAGRPGAAAAPALAEATRPEAEDARALLVFDVAGQDWALPLAVVEEIAAPPADLAAYPLAETALIALTAHRGRLLALMSLRRLLGFPAAAASGREKMVVLTIGRARIGLVVDRLRDVLRAPESTIEATPAMLAARTGGETRVAAIHRAPDGRLVSILEPAQLFREDVMRALGSADAAAAAERAVEDGDVEAGGGQAARAVLVFALGAESFALPVAAVDEVARVPAAMTRVPGAPPFLEGVINLRGEVLPVIDQRRRFGLPPVAGDGRRLVVTRAGAHRAGLIVDAVAGVRRIDPAAIQPAPQLPGETRPLVEGVIALPGEAHIVLLLDPEALLSQAERGLLAAFADEAAAADRPEP